MTTRYWNHDGTTQWYSDDGTINVVSTERHETLDDWDVLRMASELWGIPEYVLADMLEELAEDWEDVAVDHPLRSTCKYCGESPCAAHCCTQHFGLPVSEAPETAAGCTECSGNVEKHRAWCSRYPRPANRCVQCGARIPEAATYCSATCSKRGWPNIPEDEHDR